MHWNSRFVGFGYVGNLPASTFASLTQNGKVSDRDVAILRVSRPSGRDQQASISGKFGVAALVNVAPWALREIFFETTFIWHFLHRLTCFGRPHRSNNRERYGQRG